MAERAPEVPTGAGEVEFQPWLARMLYEINQEARLHFHPEFIFRLWRTCVEHWHDELGRSLEYAGYRYLLLMQKALFTHMRSGCRLRHGDPPRQRGERVPILPGMQ
ncbi:vpx protein [Simian immunodeficiency virus]|uniref:Protein Vpr n=1 Tax=Simian immunodeficiency virus TaxID=11723 RepID=E1ANU0_SIV|nr:vpx protein [Simian immunodeficiency virus]